MSALSGAKTCHHQQEKECVRCIVFGVQWSVYSARCVVSGAKPYHGTTDKKEKDCYYVNCPEYGAKNLPL